jgi:hypothetical protein
VLIAVLYGVAACANSSNIVITFSSDNFSGQGENNKFILTAYLHVVTNVSIYSVTHTYIAVGHTTMMATFAIVWLNNILQDL